MYISNAKRLTAAGARRIMDTALARAQEAGVAITVAIVDAGGVPTFGSDALATLGG